MNYYHAKFMQVDDEIIGGEKEEMMDILFKSKQNLLDQIPLENKSQISDFELILLRRGVLLIYVKKESVEFLQLPYSESEQFWDENLEARDFVSWLEYQENYIRVTRQDEIEFGEDLIVFTGKGVFRVKSEIKDAEIVYAFSMGDNFQWGFCEIEFIFPTEVRHWHHWGEMCVLDQIAAIAANNEAPIIDKVVEKFLIQIQGIDVTSLLGFILTAICEGSLVVVKYNKYFLKVGKEMEESTEMFIGLIKEGQYYQGQSYLRGLLKKHGFKSYHTKLVHKGFEIVLEPSHYPLRPLYIYGELREKETLYEIEKATEAQEAAEAAEATRNIAEESIEGQEKKEGGSEK